MIIIIEITCGNGEEVGVKNGKTTDRSSGGVPLLAIGKLSGGKGGASGNDGKSPQRGGGLTPTGGSSPPTHHSLSLSGGSYSTSANDAPPTPPPLPQYHDGKESPRFRTNTHKFAADFEKLQVLSDRRRSAAPGSLKPLKQG